MFTKHLPKRQIILLLADIILISTAHLLGILIIYGPLSPYAVEPSAGGMLVLIIYLFTFYISNLYDLDVRFKSPKYIFKFLIAVFAASALVALFFFLLPALEYPGYGRGIHIICTCLVGVLTYLWRLLFELVFKGFLRSPKKLLIVGAGRAGRVIYEVIKGNPDFNVVGFIDDDPKKHCTSNSPKVLGGCTILDDMITKHQVDKIVLAITHVKSPLLLNCMLHSKMEGILVYSMPDLYEEVAGKLPVEHIDDLWFVNTPMAGVRSNIYTRKGKRVVDIVCSIAGLLCSLPIMLFTAIAIKLDTKGPIIFRQKRVSSSGDVFEVLKFRSMCDNAEVNGAVWATLKDSRITRVGRVIRKLRVDELPQIFNVLKGEMSFIGPRPERPEFVKTLKEKVPYYSLRHSIKPGITGWAQVNYPYGASEEDAREKLCYDLFYIKNLSPLLDFHILLKTVRVVLFGSGAR